MKRSVYFAVLVGAFVGVLMGAGMIFAKGGVAYGDDEGSFWNGLIAAGGGFSWPDVFGREKPENLYLLIYKKLMTETNEEATLLVAKNSGYTTDELRSILAGSLTAVYNNPDNGRARLTNLEALGIVAEVQKNYEDVKDLLDTSQEVESLIAPSEIFSNGSLDDSGFDLVRDLEMMEAILFVETQPVTVGAEYVNKLKDPLAIARSFLPNVKDAEVTDQALTADVGEVIDTDAEGNFAVNVGEQEIEGQLLEEDVCVEDDYVAEGLKAAELVANEAGNGGVVGGVEDIVGLGDGPELGTAESGLVAAEAGDWGNSWCPGFEDFDGSYDNFSGENIGGFLSNFQSLGGGSTSPLGAAYGSHYKSKRVQLDASVCITVNLVREVYTSYYPGKTCVLCEVRKINQYLDQTLSHSLLPNKATGNLMESAKCKDTGSLFNLQFIVLFNPVMQPPNENLVIGNNIFDEWNKFTKSYQPLLLNLLQFTPSDAPDTSDQGLADVINRRARGNATNLEVLNEVREASGYYQSEALKETGETGDVNKASNAIFYDNRVLLQMKEMNKIFNSLNQIFNKINNGVLPEIKAKPDLG